jgi:hypothetical protein
MANQYLATPPTQSAYSIFFNEMFSDLDMAGIPTGFRAFWANSRPKYAPDASAFSVDIRKGVSSMAKLVRRGNASPNGLSLDEKRPVAGKYTNTTRQFPLSEDISALGAGELLFRVAGENPYGEKTRIERMRSKASDLYVEHVRRALQLNEYLASRAIQEGRQPYILGSAIDDDYIDYCRSTDNTFACVDQWDDTNGVPLTDFSTACVQAQVAGHTIPNMAIMDPYSATAFVDAMADVADIRSYGFIRLAMDGVPANLARFTGPGGFTYLGRAITKDGYRLEIFVCNQGYINDDGDFVNYMDAKTTVLANSETRFDLIIGPPEMLPMGPTEQNIYSEVLGVNPDLSRLPSPNLALTPAGSIYHDAYFSGDRKSLQLRTQSAFVYAPFHTDSIVTLTSCAK